MSNTTFAVSPEVKSKRPLEQVDYIGKLRTALRRPIEATWLPRNPLVSCDENHALLSALRIAFYGHVPLRLSPDVIWVTLARGFALHVNQNAEQFRRHFVDHRGKETLVVRRLDFQPGEDNPWPEAFEEFSEQLAERTAGLTSLVEADFSTTGAVERAVSRLMAMETFKSYFEYIMMAGCGIPMITLTGTTTDWQKLREKTRRFADYGLQDWIDALDPILAQFELAKAGMADAAFWRSMFRYNSGSGPTVLTGWANVLFPYFKDHDERLFPNPYLKEWRERLEIDDGQDWRERRNDPQGVGMDAFPSCLTSIPLKVFWGDKETNMRFVGGLMGVTCEDATLTVEPELGWAVVYDDPIEPLASQPPCHEGGARSRERVE